MNPIGHDAQPSDPRWQREFLELAHGLVMAGAKTKLIARFTGLSIRKIRSLYLMLRSTAAPSGPIAQGQARFFAMRSTRTSSAWSIQCAIFLACYEHIETIAERPLHRGWRLLAAFNCYLSLTEALKQTTAVKRLDINQGYALLTHCGFLEEPTAELQRRQCPTCLIRYPVVTTLSLKTQQCPVCSMNANSRRLARQASPAARKAAAKRR
jgi:hypothetical protein